MLELVLGQRKEAAPAILFMRVFGAYTDERLPPRLTPALRADVVRIYPEPRRRVAPAALRRWYVDVWQGLPASEQRSLILAAGAGTAALFSHLEPEPMLLAGIRDPLDLLRTALPPDFPLPSLGSLLALESPRDERPKHALWALANPQSSALLLGRPEADELPITLGPPPDADRWRDLLFVETVPKLAPVAIDQLSQVALATARKVGYPPRRLQAAATAPPPPEETPREVKETYADLFRQLNWLDDELYQHLSGGSSNGNEATQ